MSAFFSRPTAWSTKRWVITFGSLILLFLIGWRLFGMWMMMQGGMGGPGADFKVPVIAAPAQAETIRDELAAVGALSAAADILLVPEIAGKVVQVSDAEGQQVEAGTMLVQLDDSILQAELAQAEADVRLARANFARAQELLASKAMSARSRDEAAAALARAEASVALAKAQLDKTKITAPFAGALGVRQVSVGDYVQVGQALFTLVSLDPLQLDFSVPETAQAQIKLGAEVIATIPALAEKKVVAKIVAIESRANDASRSFQVRARLANPDGLLKPGMFARVSVTLATRDKALIVPESAIVMRREGAMVYVVRGDKAELLPVQIGVRQRGRVEILQGINANDAVVSDGQIKLFPGMGVQILQDAPKQ